MDGAGLMKIGLTRGIRSDMPGAKRLCCDICIGRARRTSIACHGEMPTKISSKNSSLAKVTHVSISVSACNPGKTSIKIVIIEKQWLWGGGHSFDLKFTRLKTHIKAYNVTNFCLVFVIYFTTLSRTQYSVTSNDRMIN